MAARVLQKRHLDLRLCVADQVGNAPRVECVWCAELSANLAALITENSLLRAQLTQREYIAALVSREDQIARAVPPKSSHRKSLISQGTS